jgi:hypothetical protein
MCNNCLMTGPKAGTWNPDYADFITFGFARKMWNELPRKEAVNA